MQHRDIVNQDGTWCCDKCVGDPDIRKQDAGTRRWCYAHIEIMPAASSFLAELPEKPPIAAKILIPLLQTRW